MLIILKIEFPYFGVLPIITLFPKNSGTQHHVKFSQSFITKEYISSCC